MTSVKLSGRLKTHFQEKRSSIPEIDRRNSVPKQIYGHCPRVRVSASEVVDTPDKFIEDLREMGIHLGKNRLEFYDNKGLLRPVLRCK